jgi:hypothetical protein
MQSGIHHFHAGIAQRGGDDLGPAIVAVQPGLGNQNTDGSS